MRRGLVGFTYDVVMTRASTTSAGRHVGLECLQGSLYTHGAQPQPCIIEIGGENGGGALHLPHLALEVLSPHCLPGSASLAARRAFIS